MKVKMLKRDPADYLRETKKDIHKIQRNFAPEQHPFEGAREYQRAMNAAKLDRVFAKPFLAALSGHTDGVSSICVHPNRVSWIASTSFDGEVRLWDLSHRKCIMNCEGHPRSYARAITFGQSGDRMFSVGDDKTLKAWDVPGDLDGEEAVVTTSPVDTILAKGVLTDLSHHRYDNTIATCGDVVTLWDMDIKSQINEFQWGVDTVHSIRFNQIEPNILASCASDRSIILYDIRERQPMKKVVLALRSNQVAWNPMEAFTFVVANEDYNVYAFDMRQLKRPQNVHMDHTSAVTCVSFAPTGKEIVSGSYDKTIRLFHVDHGHSREVYHTKRMQRLTCVAWTSDNRYILSGSDEMNIRLWKAKASEKLGILKDRQKMALRYADTLKEKYSNHPEIRKIIKHRHVPKHVYHARKEHQTIKESQKRKEANRRKHSKKGSVPFVSERDKHVVKEES